MVDPTSDRAITIEPAGFTPLETAPDSPPPRRNQRHIVLAGSAAVFVLLMLFLLTSRSLQVIVHTETTPDISVSGLVLPFGERYLLREGEYEVTVTAEGYQPLQTQVTVDDRDGQTVELTPQPLPGLLSFTSEPAGASVSINGELLGKTPLLEIPVAAGEHQLTLEEQRHLTVSEGLIVEGRNIPQQLSFQLSPAWAAITVDSLPPEASILVDGEVAARTPAILEVLQGEHQLALQIDGYAHWQQTIEVVADQPQDLGRIELQPAPGILQLDSKPQGANVTLDGEFQGQTPLSLQLAPGHKHRLAVFKPGYRRYNSTVRLPAAGSDSQVVQLKAQLGKVQFKISPANAMLRINGRPRGKGSQTLSLPAVEHSVEISLEGYAPVRRRVTPRPGLAQLVDVTLLTEKNARMARIKPEITTSLGQTLLLFNPTEAALAEFSMGASRREPGRRANEVLHPVALQRMFYLQTTEVTNAQFRQFQAGHNSGQVESNSLNRDHQPAVQVTWQQAAAFCNWLSAREGLPLFYSEKQGIITGFNPAATGYRLPSEAEWAWAARASGKNLLKFPWGDTFPPTLAVENYADNTSAYVTGRVLNGYTDGHVVSATVASFPPNHNALYDMGGNVAEWVHDVYSIPSANGTTKTDPLGGQSGDNYVIRGAAWTHSKLSDLRLSHRDYGQAGRDDVGFRIARYAE